MSYAPSAREGGGVSERKRSVFGTSPHGLPANLAQVCRQRKKRSSTLSGRQILTLSLILRISGHAECALRRGLCFIGQ